MNKTRLTSGSKNSSKQPDANRRSFIWRTGAAMTAVLASAVTGVSKTGSGASDLKGQVDQLSHQLGMLEDANAIRSLHQAYEANLDRGLYEEVAGMFTGDAEVVYNGGLFAGKDGIRRLYCDHFSSGRTGRKIQPAPGFETDPEKQLDIVEVAEDRKTATAQFPYSIQAGAPMAGESSLLQMARLQGEGIRQWWEGGVHEASYVKQDNAWKIQRLEYRVTAKADYKPGRAYAKPVSVPLFSLAYPKNPTGPDRLIS